MFRLLTLILYIISVCLFCYYDHKNDVQGMVYFGVFSILLYLVQLCEEIKDAITSKKGN